MNAMPQVTHPLLQDIVIAEDGKVQLPAAVLTWLGWSPGTALLVELGERGVQLSNWD